MSRTWASIFPPRPSFNEKNVGDLKDKVAPSTRVDPMVAAS